MQSGDTLRIVAKRLATLVTAAIGGALPIDPDVLATVIDARIVGVECDPSELTPDEVEACHADALAAGARFAIIVDDRLTEAEQAPDVAFGCALALVQHYRPAAVSDAAVADELLAAELAHLLCATPLRPLRAVVPLTAARGADVA